MLDFLLLRPKDYPIWQYNTPDMLQYIVVDELHTFDGAQGIDLACLMRRLFHRLKTSADKICFAGTSATLGSGQAGRDKMLAFAGKLFGTTFDEHSIIVEDLLNPKEFIDVKDIVDSYASLLEENGIEYFKINQASILDKRKKGIRLATMHRVKGIEFDYVILVSVCDGIVPSDFILAVQENETDKQNVLRKERSLLYVALTRARKAVFVTGYKKLSSLLTYEKITS